MEFISVKFILIGLALGLFVGAGWIGVRYIMSARLRVGTDITEIYGLSVVGYISGEKLRAKWFQRPYDACTNAQQIELIAANVAAQMAQQKKNSLFLTGDSDTERCQSMTGAIAQQLKAKGLDCRVGPSIAYDVASVSGACDADAVLLVEQINVSRYETIGQEKAICERCGVSVLGSVVLD